MTKSETNDIRVNGKTMRHALRTALTEKVCLFLDQFRRATDTRIVFYGIQGSLLKAGLDRPDCVYCQLIQRELYGAELCHQMNVDGREAARGKDMHCYQCRAGLTEVVIPIHTGGYLLGYAMIGQIRTRRTPPRKVLKDWAKRRGDARLRQAYMALPHVTPDRLEALTAFFSMLVDNIVSSHMISLQGDSCLVAAIDYMNAHISEQLTLPKVAGEINRSPYSVSHAFREHLDTTFKNVVTEMRLARAEEHFTSDPGLTIAEVAERVGYEDPFYFSRVYRKYRGEAPSELLRRLRSESLD